MSSKLGPIDLQCDAPHYAVVQACHSIGLKTPEDVRWCKRTHFLVQQKALESVATQPLQRLANAALRGLDTCSCGHALPLMQGFTFTFTTGEEISYSLGQCSRCHTVFWDDIG